MGIAILTSVLTIVFVILGIKFTIDGNKKSAQIISFLIAGVSAMFSVYGYVNSIKQESEPTNTITTVPTTASTTSKEINNTSFETAKEIDIATNQGVVFKDAENKLFYCFTLSDQTLFSVQVQHNIVDCQSTFCRYSLYYENNTEDPFYSEDVSYSSAKTVSDKIRKPEGKYYLVFEPSYDLDKACKELSFEVIKELNSSTSTEIESNDDIEKATLIDTDSKISGNSESTEDVDYYKFTLDNPCKVNIKFEHQLYDEDDEYWNVMLFSQNSTESIVNETIKSKSVTKTTTTVNLSPNIPTTYYIKVTPNYNTPSDEYTITVNTVQLPSSPDGGTKLAESEPNDDVKNATQIKINKRIEGNIQSDSDIDYYKFSITNEGKINVVFEHDFYDSEDEYWKINLISENGDLDFQQIYVKRNEKKVTSDTIRLSPGIYYVRIEPTYHYLDETYYVKIKYS